MDATQITELRTWASRLEERATDDELRAAGKAILMLVDEVENLQAKAARPQVTAPLPAAPAPEQPSPPADQPWEAADDRLSGSFVSRLKRTLGFE